MLAIRFRFEQQFLGPLADDARAALDELFVRLPALRRTCELRWQLTDIFNTAPDRQTAARPIASWWADAAAPGLDRRSTGQPKRCIAWPIASECVLLLVYLSTEDAS
jgi:hypothetical protein